MTIRHPPGRSGRLWLMDRLAVAGRAASILHRKQQALRHEERRLGALVERTEAAWTASVREAETWQRRAMILGARPDLQVVTGSAEPAIVRLTWRTQMGVQFPAEASCELPSPPDIAGTTALGDAAAAYRRALRAAVEHAAATSAHARVDAELTMTQHRLRVVRDRWIPALTAALAEVELRLDEQEREELTRTRVHQRTTRTLAPSRTKAP